ncbi:MAG: hypothetical protein LBV72_10810 [Tannerella sp.]|jgi:hypothetical protein|nr:hypothetical protein [Tannerella sp.]
MDFQKQEPDNTVIFVPDEIVRNINRALDNMEKARRGLIKARDEKNAVQKDAGPLAESKNN